MLVAGLDPGIEGALAVLEGGEDLVYLGRLPSRPDINGRSIIDVKALDTLLRGFPKFQMVAVERVHSMPTDHNAAAFAFGGTNGRIMAVVELLEVPVVTPTPGQWQKALLAGQDKGKEASVAYVRQRFPLVNLKATPKSRKDDHNLAEAVLLALYAHQELLK